MPIIKKSTGELSKTIASRADQDTASLILNNNFLRRLTPIECERLQGFPDDYTNIIYRGKKAQDCHRYAAIGNSMAVPVMTWIGKRIQQISMP